MPRTTEQRRKLLMYPAPSLPRTNSLSKYFTQRLFFKLILVSDAIDSRSTVVVLYYQSVLFVCIYFTFGCPFDKVNVIHVVYYNI